MSSTSQIDQTGQTEFENVRLSAKANVYHDGKVLSHTFYMPNGDRKTLGIMFPGDFTFGTGDAEIMAVVAGALTVLLPGRDQWETFGPGTSFRVPGNSAFQCKCGELSEYVCSYVKD